MTAKDLIEQAINAKQYHQILPILKANESDVSLINSVYKSESGTEMSLAMMLVRAEFSQRPKDLLQYVLTHKSLDLHYTSESTLLKEIAIHGDIESFKHLMNNPDIYFDKDLTDTTKTILTYSLFKSSSKLNEDKDYQDKIATLIKSIRYITYHLAIKTNNESLISQLVSAGDALLLDLTNPLDESPAAPSSSTDSDKSPLMLLIDTGDVTLWKSVMNSSSKNPNVNQMTLMEELRYHAYMVIARKIKAAKKETPLDKDLINNLEKKLQLVRYCIYQNAIQRKNPETLNRIRSLGDDLSEWLINPCETGFTPVSPLSLVEDKSSAVYTYLYKTPATLVAELVTNSLFKKEKTVQTAQTVENEEINNTCYVPSKLKNNYN